MATTKKRTTTAKSAATATCLIVGEKPVTQPKARSTSKGVASSRRKARRDTTVAPILRFTPEEWAAYLERQTQREMGISVAEFRRAFAAGELDNHHAVGYLAGKILISQYGTQAVA
jgi:hypothetical protein